MQYDFAVGAGQSQGLDIAGSFFKYKSGTGVIRVRASAGGYVDLLPGQGVWGVSFTSLTVTDKSGAANAGVIVAGNFDFRDDRIVGTVDVVDGGYARTLAGKAFMGIATTAATAGLVSCTQLWNPAGNTKNLIVKRYALSSAVAGYVMAKTNQIQLGTLNNVGYAKKAGGADSAALLKNATAAAGTYDFGSKLDQYSLGANANISVILQEPIIVPPGWGLMFTALTLNTDITAALEWYEEAI